MAGCGRGFQGIGRVHSLTAARLRARAAWIVPTLIGALVLGSLAVGAAAPAGARSRLATPLAQDAGPAFHAAIAASATCRRVIGTAQRERRQRPLLSQRRRSARSHDLGVTLATPATLVVTVRELDGAAVKQLAKSVSLPAGRSSWTWNGAGTEKQIVADGATAPLHGQDRGWRLQPRHVDHQGQARSLSGRSRCFGGRAGLRPRAGP